MQPLTQSNLRFVLRWTNGDPVVITLPPWQLGEDEGPIRRLYRFPNLPWERHDLIVHVPTMTVVCHYVENCHYNYNSSMKGRKMASEYLKKAARKQSGAATENEVTDPKFQAEFPALYDFLTCNVQELEGGEVVLRERCKMMIFAESGSWKCCLMDYGASASLFLTLKAPGDACKALEKALTAERPDWRFWKNQKKK